MGWVSRAEINTLCFCTRKAFAACVYRSAAFSHFSDRPPKKLKPPVAPEDAFSAFWRRARGSWAILVILWKAKGGVDLCSRCIEIGWPRCGSFKELVGYVSSEYGLG